MPPKVKNLIKQLEQSGFTNRGGKGSQRNFTHKKGINITISGKSGDDAKHYQIRAVKQAITQVNNHENS